MTPEICSVAGRRSGIAAVIVGDSILPRMDVAWMIHREADSGGSLAAGWVRVGIPGLKCRVKCRSRPEHKVRTARAAVTPDGRERDGAGYSRTQPAKCTPEL